MKQLEIGDKVIITKRYKGNYGSKGMEGILVKTDLDYDSDDSSPTFGQKIQFYQLEINGTFTWCIGVRSLCQPQTEWDGSGIKFRFI